MKSTKGLACLMAAISLVSTAAKAAPAHAVVAARQPDVLAFCKAHPTVDHPDALYFGKDPEPGALPAQIEKLDGPTKWRCMGGKVLVCMDSADGDWCGVKDTRRTPSAGIRETCRDAPNKGFIDFATGHYSAFDWRCRNGKPVIAKAYAIDARGFFKVSWKPVIVRGRAIVGPAEMPGGPR